MSSSDSTGTLRIPAELIDFTDSVLALWEKHTGTKANLEVVRALKTPSIFTAATSRLWQQYRQSALSLLRVLKKNADRFIQVVELACQDGMISWEDAISAKPYSRYTSGAYCALLCRPTTELRCPA